MTQPGDIEEMVTDKKAGSTDMSAEEKAGSTDVSAIEAAYVDEDQDIVLNTVNATYTEVDYKRVLQKVDRVLLPFMWLCCGIQQADKTSLSTQATFGLLSDTKLVGQQFSCKQFPQQIPPWIINNATECAEADSLACRADHRVLHFLCHR